MFPAEVGQGDLESEGDSAAMHSCLEHQRVGSGSVWRARVGAAMLYLGGRRGLGFWTCFEGGAKEIGKRGGKYDSNMCVY